MRQFEYVQILYAFHFDSLQRTEHGTRTRFLPRSMEFPKRRNDGPTLFRTVLLVPSPKTRSCASSAPAAPSAPVSHQTPSGFASQKPIQSCGARALANSNISSCLLSLADIRGKSLRRRRRLLSKLNQSSSSALN